MNLQYLVYKATKTDLTDVREVMPLSNYGKTSKLTEVIVLARARARAGAMVIQGHRLGRCEGGNATFQLCQY